MKKRNGVFPWWLAALAFCLAIVARAASADSPPTPEEWIGASREELVRALGQPTSTLQRGDIAVLVFANQTRVELRDGAVISFREKSEGLVIGGDGKRYTPTAHGKLQRVAIASPAKPIADPGAALTATTTAPAAAPAGVDSAPATAGEVDAGADAEEKEIESFQTAPLTMPADAPAMQTVEKLLENGHAAEPEKPPSKATVLLAFAIEVVCRFGFCLLVLRIALHWMAVPFYWPDLVKVAALYVVVRDGLHAVGGLGGAFELIRFFKIDEVLSFFALTLLLFHFKIALSGLTALKVAAAAKAATYVVMIGVGLAIAFGLYAAA